MREHELDGLLKNAWRIPAAVGLPDALIDTLDKHSRTLLAAGIEFRRHDLLLTLSRLPPQLSLPWEIAGSSEES
ncbi:hypothetical protein K4749_38715 [Streptomyces sp. TRM72054]|uniref:hypothetical protein n=1 Tax=Streptomyces sp. TRM72054 TaxID=2870562 RepID=UPI001C8B76EC|nr:hypothetical protein [Streptomyces sp. TRM72054]MBX9399330.1 hypothetical protein [Streptomyces sp. TRM72054]